MFAIDLEKLDTSSITKNSENGRNQFLYSPLASPQCIKLHVTNFESEKTPQEYDHKRVRSRWVNRYDLWYIFIHSYLKLLYAMISTAIYRETKLKDRLVNNSLNTSFANTRYSGFKNSNSELLNTPVLSRRKLARVKKARKRVSSIGIDSGNALNLSQNWSINDQYLRNNVRYFIQINI